MTRLQVQTGSQKGQVFLLRPPGPILVGRDLDADFPVFDRRVSRHHFQIDFTDEGVRVTDLGSRAGTVVNDRRVQSAFLTDGSQIIAGRTLLVFSSPRRDDPLLGRVLAGYEVLEQVGSGGMGVVYRALQKSLDRIVALKILPRHLSRDEEFCRLFVREARAAARLSHPNIVHVYDVNMAEEVLFYAMEHMAHGSVGDLCQIHGALSQEETVRIALDAARGLEFAAQKDIVHLDIKPSNLMIHENGTVKIVDLGIATHLKEPPSPAASQALKGSPHYMSPEQVLRRDVDARTDLYSLGASMFRMLAGRPPFEGRTVKEILTARLREPPPDLLRLRPDVLPALGGLVSGLLARDPAARPASAAEVIRRLEGIRSDLDLDEGLAASAGWARWGRRAFLAGLVPVMFLAGNMLGTAFAQLRWKIRVREANLNRIRALLAETRRLLEAGEVEAARSRRRQLAELPGSPLDWEWLEPEIAALDAALQAAESDPDN
jgi:hypothetical protein